MPKLAPITKLILTVAVSVWALFIPTLSGQVALAVGQLLLLLLYRPTGKHVKAVGGLLIFAGLLVAIQYVFGSSLEFSLMSGLNTFMPMERHSSINLVISAMLFRLFDNTAAMYSEG